MTNTQKRFVPPPVELLERWISAAKEKPTDDAAYGYVSYKAAEWGFNSALELDPNSIKSKALRALDKISSIDVVSIWIGKDAISTIREALNKLPNN